MRPGMGKKLFPLTNVTSGDRIKSRVGPLQRAAWGFLLPATLGLCAALSGCAGLAASNGEMPVTGPDPSYRTVVATRLKEVLKNYSTYASFEVSDPRWVNSINGWTWLTCVRFRELAQPGPDQIVSENNPTDRPQGRMHYYALFLDGNKVVDDRFAVQIDNCDLQTYYPLEPWHRPAAYDLIYPRKWRHSTPRRSPH